MVIVLVVWRRGWKGWTTLGSNQEGAAKIGIIRGHQAYHNFWGRQNCSPPRMPLDCSRLTCHNGPNPIFYVLNCKNKRSNCIIPARISHFTLFKHQVALITWNHLQTPKLLWIVLCEYSKFRIESNSYLLFDSIRNWRNYSKFSNTYLTEISRATETRFVCTLPATSRCTHLSPSAALHCVCSYPSHFPDHRTGLLHDGSVRLRTCVRAPSASLDSDNDGAHVWKTTSAQLQPRKAIVTNWQSGRPSSATWVVCHTHTGCRKWCTKFISRSSGSGTETNFEFNSNFSNWSSHLRKNEFNILTLGTAKTIRFDSKFRIIVQYSIRFEMKKHYSHSTNSEYTHSVWPLTSPGYSGHDFWTFGCFHWFIQATWRNPSIDTYILHEQSSAHFERTEPWAIFEDLFSPQQEQQQQQRDE